MVQDFLHQWYDTVSARVIYLEGQGDLVSRFIMGISLVTVRLMGVINLLTKSP